MEVDIQALTEFPKDLKRILTKSIAENAMISASPDDQKKAGELLRILNVISNYNWSKGWVEETSEFDRAQMQKQGGSVAMERLISSSGFEVGKRIFIGGYGIGKKKDEFRPFIPVKLPATPKEFIRVFHGYLAGTIEFARPQAESVDKRGVAENKETANAPKEPSGEMSPDQRLATESVRDLRVVVGRLGMSVMFTKEIPYTAAEVRVSLAALADALQRIANRPGNHMQSAPTLYVRFVKSGEPVRVFPHTDRDQRFIVVDLPPNARWNEIYNACIGTFL